MLIHATNDSFKKVIVMNALQEMVKDIIQSTDNEMGELQEQIEDATETTKGQIRLATKQIELEKEKIVAEMNKVSDQSKNKGDKGKEANTELDQFLKEKKAKIDSLILTVQSQLKRL